MGRVVKLKDGEIRTIFDLGDIFELIDEFVGDEVTTALKDEMADDEDLEKAYDDLYEDMQKKADHYREVMDELRKQSGIIANLISEKEINRRELSTAAGRIGTITWRELS